MRISEHMLSAAERLPGRPLPVSFYDRNTLQVARDLLGCWVCRKEGNGSYSFGRIVETEAYRGEDDPACHAAAGRTPRTQVLYGPPGHAYVYFNYGMHYLLNAVTETEGYPGAVLIRAAEPRRGVRRMMRRRRRKRAVELMSGPSRLCQALNVDLCLNRTPLVGPHLVIRRGSGRRPRILVGPRVGIRVGTDRPWRFRVADSPFVSRARAAVDSVLE